MTEINNNIQKFTITPKEIGKIAEKKQEPVEEREETAKEPEVIRDTGVIGRSLVEKNDISKSVDETVALAKQRPDILIAGDKLFDKMYDEFVKNGMNESDAYFAASSALEEFTCVAAGA